MFTPAGGHQGKPMQHYNPEEFREVQCEGCGYDEFRQEFYIKLLTHRLNPKTTAVVQADRLFCKKCDRQVNLAGQLCDKEGRPLLHPDDPRTN